jgi:RNA polymerase sigma factor (sigma-70 family)
VNSQACVYLDRVTGLPLGWLVLLWPSSSLRVDPVQSSMADMVSPTGKEGIGLGSGAARGRAGQFPLTHWTLVMGAGKGSSPDAREAFGKLYEAYRPALLAFLRRDGLTDDEAGDVVQGFFASLLETQSLGRVQRTGRFRCWLLVSLKHFLADRRDKLTAQKRGGGETPAPLGEDAQSGEVDPPHPGRTPDEEFDRQFALRFLELVMARLEQEYSTRGKARHFQHLQPWLLDKKGGMSHAELGSQLGLSEAAVNTEVSRLRKRYRLVFDEQLLNLVGGPEEVAEEKRLLFAAVAR